MANGKLNLGKQSGGVLSLAFPDGVTNTEVVLPESGTVASVDGAVTDNAVARYDGTTGKLQDSGVIIDDNGNLGVGTSSVVSLGGASRTLIVNSEFDCEAQVKGSRAWLNTYSTHTAGDGFGGWNHYNNNGIRTEWVNTAGDSSLSLGANGAERMRITNTGNLLVGTTTDNGVDKLQVNGSISSGSIKVYNSGDLNNFRYITETIGTYPSAFTSNTPIDDYGYLEVIVYSVDWVLQRFTCLGATNTAYAGRTFVRCFTRGTTWTPWVEK